MCVCVCVRVCACLCRYQLIERCPSALGSMGEIIDQLISCMSRGMQPPLRGGKPLSSEGAESIFSRLGKADSAHIAGRLISEVAAARPLLTAPAPRGPLLSGVLVTLLKGKSGEDASFALGQLWDKCCAPSCCASSCYTPSGTEAIQPPSADSRNLPSNFFCTETMLQRSLHQPLVSRQ
jgi:hypothetical protein